MFTLIIIITFYIVSSIANRRCLNSKFRSSKKTDGTYFLLKSPSTGEGNACDVRLGSMSGSGGPRSYVSMASPGHVRSFCRTMGLSLSSVPPTENYVCTSRSYNLLQLCRRMGLGSVPLNANFVCTSDSYNLSQRSLVHHDALKELA